MIFVNCKMIYKAIIKYHLYVNESQIPISSPGQSHSHQLAFLLLVQYELGLL